MLDPIGIIKIAEKKGVAMTDRFSKLYKESAVAKKAEQKLSCSCSKAKKPLKQKNGFWRLKLQTGPRKKILGHKKLEKKKL